LQLAGGSPLPSTPELNEEASGRSASPDIRLSDQGQCDISSLKYYKSEFAFCVIKII